jgi:hypothetical protein
VVLFLWWEASVHMRIYRRNKISVYNLKQGHLVTFHNLHVHVVGRKTLGSEKCLFYFENTRVHRFLTFAYAIVTCMKYTY